MDTMDTSLPSTTCLPRLLKAREVAKQTGLPLARVYELSRQGTIPCIKLGRSYRYDAAKLRNWLNDGGTRPTEG